MKKLILCILIGLFMIAVPNAGAANVDTKDFSDGTKEQAITYIKESLSDPQISEWVTKKFFSERLFKTALKMAPEKTVKEIAVNFSDFQKVGGEFKDDNVRWQTVLVIIALVLGILVFMSAVAAV